MGSLPVGLERLVRLVVEEHPASDLAIPRTQAGIWEPFTYCAFIGANRLEAEASYLHQMMDSHGLLRMDEVLKHRIQWANRVRVVARKQMRKLKPGRKLGLLSAFANSQVDDLNRCLLEAANYFRSMKVSRSFIRERTRSREDTEAFVCEIYHPNSDHHIFNVGLTRTILWLQSFGLALDLCPPSRQVVKFVNEDLGADIRPSFYDEDQDMREVRANDWLCMAKVRRVAEQLTGEFQEPITTRDVGLAVWYYKSCQSLLARFRTGLRRKFTPATLTGFLDSKRWNLNRLSDLLCDIDEIDELTIELKDFTSST